MNSDEFAALCSAGSAFIWPAVGGGAALVVGRHRGVGGDWLQLTYTDNDREAPLATIEYVTARQLRHRVWGKMHRLYGGSYRKRWKFRGTCDGHMLRGDYHQTRDVGDEGGLIDMSVLSSGEVWGIYMYTRTVPADSGRVTQTRTKAAMEWVPLAHVRREGPFIEWLRRTPDDTKENYPFSMKRRLYGLWDPSVFPSEGFAAAGAPHDPGPLLEIQKRSRGRRGNDIWGATSIYRRDVVGGGEDNQAKPGDGEENVA